MPSHLYLSAFLSRPFTLKEWATVLFPLVLLVAPLLALVIKRKTEGRGLGAPKPPGPKRWPLIGSLLSMPRPSVNEASWEVYAQWQKDYGDMVYLDAAGQKLLILNTLSAVDDLLNKRAANYSDRLESTILYLSRHEWSFGFINYGPHWKEQRRVFHQFFNQNHIQQPEIRRVINQELFKLLKSLLKDQASHDVPLKMFFGRVIMRLSYGMSVHDEEYTLRHINMASTLASEQVLAIEPGKYLVGLMPWLQYIPAWFPGAGWKRRLQALGHLNDRVLAEPFDELRQRMRTGLRHEDEEYTPNIATQLIEDLPDESSDNFEYRSYTARAVSATAYGAGVDTSVSSGQALLLALAMHPEVQQKAQALIDAELAGRPNRLPTWGDLEKVPFVQAILKEAARWHTVLPLGLPHVSRQDDIYDGYQIPAQTAILPNTWAIMHDPKNFEDPFDFKPDRYLTEDGQINPAILSPEDGVFGYGRRVCPGQFLARETLGIMAMSLLACFEISPTLDENGQPKPLSLNASTNTLSAPLPFEIVIRPRSLEHADLILEL